MKFATVVILIIFHYSSIGQQKIDSLEHMLTDLKSDEDKVEIMSDLVELYGDKPEAELYVKSMLDLGEKEGGGLKSIVLKKAYQFYLKRGEKQKAVEFLKTAVSFEKLNGMSELFSSYELYGKWFQSEVQFDSAVKYFRLSEEGFKTINDYKSLCNVLNVQGILLKNIQSYGEALEKYYEAYDIAKTHHLDKNLASTCVNIGVVFKKQDQLDDAMEYYQQAEELYKKENNYLGLANAYNNIGNIYRIQDKYKWALTYYKKAIKNRKLGGSEKTLSYSYNNIALVFKEQLQYDSALFYLGISEKLKIKLSENSSLSSTYLNFADTYSILNDSINFLKYYNAARKYALDYKQYTIVEELNVLYSKYAASKGNYKQAYDFLISVIQQMDTLSNKEQKVLSQVLQAQYNDKQKQELIIELENSLAKQNQQAEELKSDEEKLWLMVTILIVVFCLLTVALVMVFRSFNRLKAGAKEFESINRELKKTRLGAEEKEMMIKEIHHRVKNNLQVVKSLIRLQKESLDEGSVAVLTEFENRVSSIALVHESLHGSVDLSKVDVEDYYKKLIQDLIEVYSVKQQIKSVIKVDELTFGIDTLIPLGLMTNEIVSNALKHAFEGRENGEIYVELKHLDQENYQLEISDNGNGISEDFLEKGSLGLELIDTLVMQLDGTKTLEVENGTKYIIKFKNQDKIK